MAALRRPMPPKDQTLHPADVQRNACSHNSYSRSYSYRYHYY